MMSPNRRSSSSFTQAQTWHRHISLVARHDLLLLTGLALVVRAWRLTYHSLWFDEAVSTWWAAQPVSRLLSVGLRLSEDKHPPLYYLLLHGWTMLFGNSDMAVRSLGVLLGTVAVPVVYVLGQALGGRRLAWMATLLTAFNPILVWYSQEARMFMPATTFGLLGLYGLVQAMQGQSRLWWMLFVIGTAVAVYTYLLSGLLLPVAATWVLITLISELPQTGTQLSGRMRWLLLWGTGALIATGLLVTPLLWQAWQVSGMESPRGEAFANLIPITGRLLHAYTLFKAFPPGPTGYVVLPAALLLLLLGWALPSSNRGVRARLAIAILMPWGLVMGLQARNAYLVTEVRYLLFIVPFLLLSWARGIVVLTRRWSLIGWTVAAGVFLVELTALPALWQPQALREDWRAAARYVEEHAGPADAVLVHVDYVNVAFRRYFRGPQPVYFPFHDRVVSEE
ncbi:MAG TPA: hypothetical protein EYH31_07865, partial [Anaerolineae bacterium]|nr:hypothetical protein [Anaerolineae bacterium]